MRPMRRTHLALALLAPLAGCHAGPGDFPGDFESVRYVATYTVSGTGRQISENDTNVKLSAADGENGGDVVLKLTGNLACNLYGSRSGLTLELKSTTDCTYTQKTDTFQMSVSGGGATLEGTALSVTLSGTFTHPIMNMPAQTGAFTGTITATKK